jgi:glycine/D-amino acid oxidase-like deaminating enzyme
VRNHVLVTSPAPPLLRDGSRCGVGCGAGFVYFIQRRDGRVVLGGFRDREPSCGVDEADDSAAADEPTARAAARAFLWEHFALPAEVEVEQEWTGIIGWSCDDMPWVGAMPGQPGTWVCAGFCGSGLSRAFACGLAVADMVGAHSRAEHSRAWHGMAWHGMAWHGMAWHGMASHGMALHGIA